MNPQEVMPLIDPLDAAIVPFLADPNRSDSEKGRVRSRRDNINRLISEAGDSIQKVIEDYKRRIQSEIDSINRDMQP